MKRFFSVLLAVVLLYTGGFSYMELSVRAENDMPEILVDAPEEPLPEEAAEPSPLSDATAAEPAAEPEPTSEPEPAPEPEPTPEPEPAPEPEPTPDPTAPPAVVTTPKPARAAEPSGPRPGYYIMINVQANTVTVYTSDDNGVYNQPYRAMICSTGDATPWSGSYELGWRARWQNLFGGVYGQYVSQITGNILFHSVPYTKKYDKGSLEYWEFDQLGTACSMGCVRLQVKDAKWIYDNFYSIAGVEFYSSDDPGPLGKPSAPKISGSERCRGWDPTDPDPSNPWLQPDADVPAAPTPELPEDEVLIEIEPEPAPAQTTGSGQGSAPESVPEQVPDDDEIIVG